MNCFTGKPAASTREEAEKAQWSEVKLSATWGWLLGGQSPCTQRWNPIISARPPVLGEPGVMGWEQLSDLTAVTCFVSAHGWLPCQPPWSRRRCKARRKEQKNQERRGATALKHGRKGLDAGYHYPGFGYWSIPSTILIILSLARCITGNIARDGTPKWEFLHPQHCMSCWMQLCACVWLLRRMKELVPLACPTWWKTSQASPCLFSPSTIPDASKSGQET